MNRIYLKRIFTVAMAVLLALTFTLMTTTQVNAASKKTVYLPTSINTTYTYDGGSDKWTESYSYDKNGLVKTETSKGGGQVYKAVFTRNTKGIITGVKRYTNGKLTTTVKNTLNKKKTQVTKSVSTSKEGKTTYTSTTTYKYYGNGKTKQSVRKSTTNPPTSTTTSTTNYRKDGTAKDTTYKSDTSNDKTFYDTKGRPTKETYQYKSPFDGSVSKTVSKYTYKTNGNGDVTKMVKTDTNTESDGTVTKATNTTNYKYKYDKHKNIIWQETKTTEVGADGKTSTSSTVMTCKYKAFKVDKKYANANDLVE